MTGKAPAGSPAEPDEASGGHAAARLREQLLRDLGGVSGDQPQQAADQEQAGDAELGTDADDSSHREGSP